MNSMQNQNQSPAKNTRLITGTVVSVKMKDTAVVEVARYQKFPKYGKYLVRTKRLKAHDAGNTCKPGDVVFLKPTRPISKDKHYAIAGTKSRAKVLDSLDISPKDLTPKP